MRITSNCPLRLLLLLDDKYVIVSYQDSSGPPSGNVRTGAKRRESECSNDSESAISFGAVRLFRLVFGNRDGLRDTAPGAEVRDGYCLGLSGSIFALL